MPVECGATETAGGAHCGADITSRGVAAEEARHVGRVAHAGRAAQRWSAEEKHSERRQGENSQRGGEVTRRVVCESSLLSLLLVDLSFGFLGCARKLQREDIKNVFAPKFPGEKGLCYTSRYKRILCPTSQIGSSVWQRPVFNVGAKKKQSFG